MKIAKGLDLYPKAHYEALALPPAFVEVVVCHCYSTSLLSVLCVSTRARNDAMNLI